MSMMNLASHVIARAQSIDKGVTNLQLQKVLYFTLLNAIREEIMNREQLREMYDMNFLVWRYGPVVKEVYEKYSVYGASEIFASENPHNEYDYLDNTIDDLLKVDPFKLVRESHKHSHWKEYEPTIVYGRGPIPYTVEDLIDANSD